MKNQASTSENPQSISGDTLLLYVAILSGLLPFVLIILTQFFFPWDHQQPSISDYAYSTARAFFYGIVFTLGFVLLFYRGYSKNSGPIPLSDNRLASIAGISAIIIALIPTNHCFGYHVSPVNIYRDLFWGHLHLFAALIAYGSMAIFMLFYFTQTGQTSGQLPKNKIIRNRIYRICGWVIVFCLAYLIARGVIKMINDTPKCEIYNTFSYVFWTEAIMNIAIAIGWGTKFAGRKLS